MADIHFDLDMNEPVPQDVLQRINANYSEKNNYDEDNPPLTHIELKEISARVKMNA